MAVNSYDPTDGHPIFLGTDAPDIKVDPTKAAEYAATVGTRLIGTTGERTAYEYAREGLAWFDTTLDAEFIHTGSGWQQVGNLDSGWVNLVLSAGWTAVAGHTPRARLLTSGAVFVEGAVLRGSGGFLTDIATIPESVRHTGGKTVFYASSVAQSGSSRAASELYISGGGVIAVEGYTGIDGAAGWVVPLSGSYVLDQG